MDIYRENCAKLAAHGRRKAKFAEGKEVKYISDVYSESIHYLNVHRMRKFEPEHILFKDKTMNYWRRGRDREWEREIETQGGSGGSGLVGVSVIKGCFENKHRLHFCFREIVFLNSMKWKDYMSSLFSFWNSESTYPMFNIFWLINWHFVRGWEMERWCKLVLQQTTRGS